MGLHSGIDLMAAKWHSIRARFMEQNSEPFILSGSFEIFTLWLIQIHLDSSWLFWNRLQQQHGCTLLYDTVLYDAVWCCMMLYDAVWCCISICMKLYQYLYDAVSASVWVSYPHWAVGFWPPCPKCHALNAMLEGTSAKTTKQVSHGLTVGAHESIHQEDRESQEQNSCCSCLQRVLNAITYEQMTKQYDTIRYILQIITT